MTKTHTCKLAGDPYQVTAWQFDYNKPIPVWVARKFHRIGDVGWQTISMDDNLVEAKAGDWAVCLDEGIAVVLTNEEFKKCFQSI